MILHVDSEESDHTGRMPRSFCWFSHAAVQMVSFFFVKLEESTRYTVKILTIRTSEIVVIILKLS